MSFREPLGREKRRGRDRINALHIGAYFSSFSPATGIPDKQCLSGHQNVISRMLKATHPADSATIAYSIYDGRYKANKPRTSLAPQFNRFTLFSDIFWMMSKRVILFPMTQFNILWHMKAASAIYSAEDKRRVVLTPFLCNILGVDIQMISNEEMTKLDGIAVLVTSSGRIFPQGKMNLG